MSQTDNNYVITSILSFGTVIKVWILFFVFKNIWITDFVCVQGYKINNPSLHHATCKQNRTKQYIDFFYLQLSEAGNLTLETTKDQVMTTSLALVPYDENKILPHELSSRKFYMADEEFIIEQNWQGVGVAAVVWDSAVVLGEYLQSHQYLIKGKKVIELGAGTGLAGMVAAALGADVILTERESAMTHLTQTLKTNVLNKNWKITAKVLDWTEPIDSQFSNDVDVVIGADIIYIEETFKDLLKTLKSLTSNNNVQILLSCRIRYDRDLKFLRMLKEFFDVSEIFEDYSRHIKIFSLKRI